MMKRKKIYSFMSFIVMAAFIIIISCTKDDTNDDPQKYSIGGTVEGLIESGLVLQNNNSDDLPISENGTFTFPTALDDSSEYNVTIESFPAGQTCYIENGGGMVDGADVTDVSVVCQTPIAGDCSNGSIVYSHDLANDYGGFHQDITVSGSVHFTCDDSGNLSGTGTLTITVNGTITNPCMLTTYSGTAPLNVILTGSYSVAQVIVHLNETWYVGSPMASGTATDTCDPDSQPFNYPLIETTIQHTLTFPTVDGHEIEQPYVGAGGSGYYSWALNII